MLQKKRIGWLLLLTVILMLSGCGEKKTELTDGREVYVKEDKAQKEEVETEKEPQEDKLFLVTGLDTERKKITLKGYSEQEEKEYNYTGATNIKDKYGTDIAIEKLACGEMVHVKLEKETVKSILVSDEIFTYGDVHNFTLDIEAKTITVGKNSYYYGDDIQVFYRNNKISIAEISDRDTICLKGIDKKVYAIQVTSGHGTVVLQNTDMFEGGNVTIGNVLSLDIEPDMRIEVPEGTYLLSVAKDGYGGNTEITVEANREITVNLEELEGEGPKYCTVAFVIVPENATLYLNGEVVDLSQTLQLKYGRYRLSARAEGYANWDKTLVVNSQSANIKIELQTEAEAETEAEEEKAEVETSTTTTTEEAGRAQEEAVKALIEEIRNGTSSISDSNITGNGSGSN